MSDRKLWVRLKPYNPKTGCLVRRYIVGEFSFFTDSTTERPVWNIIKESDIIEHGLNELRQVEIEHDPELRSQLLLDIATEEQYKKIEEIEKERRLAQLGFASATTSIPADPTPVKDRTGGRTDAIPEPELELLTTPDIPDPVNVNPDLLSVKDIRDDSEVNRLPLANTEEVKASTEEAIAPKRGRGRPRGPRKQRKA